MSRFYQSFEEFAREEIRPQYRAGWSLDELDIDSQYAEEIENNANEDEDEDEE